MRSKAAAFWGARLPKACALAVTVARRAPSSADSKGTHQLLARTRETQLLTETREDTAKQCLQRTLPTKLILIETAQTPAKL